MAGKFITNVQQNHVAGLLTGLIAVLNDGGYTWNRKHRQDIELAYKALGIPCPFQMRDATPEEVQPPPGLWEKIKARIGVQA